MKVCQSYFRGQRDLKWSLAQNPMGGIVGSTVNS